MKNKAVKNKKVPKVLKKREAVSLTNYRDMKIRLFEAEEALRAIREGEVDALIVHDPSGEKVFTLKTAEHSYRVFVEAMSEGAITVECDNLISYCNLSFEKMLDIPLEKLIGQSITNFVDKKQAVQLETLLNSARKKGSAKGEIQFFRNGHLPFPVLVSINSFEDQSGQTLFLVTTDLSLRKETEAVKESEKQFRTMAESISQLAWIAHSDGSIFWYNKRWFEYTGTDINQMQGWGWKSVHDPEILPKVLENWTHSIKSGEKFEMEFPIKDFNGNFRWFLTRVTPVVDHNGEVVRWFGTNTDIHKQKETERQLEYALKSRDIFLSLASHELKTPITSLQMQLQLTKRNIDVKKNTLPTPDKLLKTIDTSLKQIGRLSTLVEDLLDVTRIEAGKLRFTFEPFDLSEALEQIIENHSSDILGSNCTISTSIESNVHGVWDRSRIEQIIVNLLSNAMKYASSKSIKVSLKKSGDEILFKVADSGPGIPEEMQERIFNRFERANASRNISGLGLGLYIVKQIVIGHGGRISLKSKVGEGSTFIVHLPLDAALAEIKSENFKAVKSVKVKSGNL
jgi:two-component system phosphate regulon sensor histidine kinase PhoR